MNLGGEVLVFRLRCAVAGDDIAIGSVADRCLLSGVKQKSYFEGVRTVFGPITDIEAGLVQEMFSISDLFP
jgi:hypothetical protein